MLYPSFSFPFHFPLRSFKYRDRATIIGDILKSVRMSKDGKKMSQIMQSANLNYIQTKKYLSYLLSCGFLVYTQKKTYVITQSGSKYLQFIEMQKLHIVR